MRRVVVLVVLLTVGSLSLVVRAYLPPAAGSGLQQAPRVVNVEKLKDNLFVLKGGGGNTAVFVGATGVVVVDTKNPGWGQPLLDKINELTNKPVTTIISTHTHCDHVCGNVEFPATVDIVAHENTKAHMENWAPPTGFPDQTRNIFKENNGKGMPTRTFKDQMSLGSGMDRIDLFFFGRGHTDGDAWVVFPALRVAHAGDIFPGKSLPILDANNSGSGVAIGETLRKAASSMTNVDTIITGHSTQMTISDLQEYADFNREFLTAVQEAKKAGRSVDEVANAWKMPAKYAGYRPPQLARLKLNVQVIYDELQ